MISALVHSLEQTSARWKLRAAQSVGPGPRLTGTPYIENLGSLTIGRGFHFSSHPIQSHLVVGPRGEMTIGDHVRIAHGAAISANASVRIGNDVAIGARVVIMDSDFHARASGGDIPAEAIVIHDGVTIGDDTVLMRGAEVERGATVLAGSVVVGRVKAGLTVRGVPARAVSTTSGPQNLPTDLDERVRQVVQETFDLPVPPQASDGPHQIPAWDSLGALRLIVNLEQGLGVVLPEGVFGPEPTVARITERIATHFM